MADQQQAQQQVQQQAQQQQAGLDSIDGWLSFKSPLLRERYQQYQQSQRLDRRLLYPFVVAVILLSPFSLNSKGLGGNFGTHYQVWSFVNLSAIPVLALIIALDRFSPKAVCKFLGWTLKQHEAVSRGLWSYIMYLYPIVNGTLLIFRSRAPPCLPDVVMTEAMWCNNAAPGKCSMEVYVSMCFTALLYLSLFPVGWAVHATAWAEALVLLVVFSAMTATPETRDHHIMLFVLHVGMFGILYSLQYKSMLVFLLKVENRPGGAVASEQEQLMTSTREAAAEQEGKRQGALPAGGSDAASASGLALPSLSSWSFSTTTGGGDLPTHVITASRQNSIVSNMTGDSRFD